jgi:hypothetical protein
MIYSRKSRFIGGSCDQRGGSLTAVGPASAKAIQNLVAHLGEVAGRNLDPDLRPAFKLTPKVFRRTYACTQVILHALGLGGLDLVSLQEAMGHSRLDTTRVYLSNVASYLNAHLGRVNNGLGARRSPIRPGTTRSEDRRATKRDRFPQLVAAFPSDGVGDAEGRPRTVERHRRGRSHTDTVAATCWSAPPGRPKTGSRLWGCWMRVMDGPPSTRA